MSAQVARAVIDSLEFARTGAILRGNVPVSALTRLSGGLHDDQGAVDYRVQGGHDTRGRPTLTVDVSGMLRLTCQRCLGALDFPLRLASTLVVVDAADIAAATSDDDELDWVESSPELDVETLVEDEIILGMPYAARHADGDCRPGGETGESGIRRNVFAGLAAIRRN